MMCSPLRSYGKMGELDMFNFMKLVLDIKINLVKGKKVRSAVA